MSQPQHSTPRSQAPSPRQRPRIPAPPAPSLPGKPLQSPDTSGKPLEIPLDQIERNPYQTRSRFDEAKLDELAQSIAASGVVQPIVVKRLSDKPLPAPHRRTPLAGLRQSQQKNHPRNNPPSV